MIYIGIDPGAKGGIAIINEDEVHAYAYSDDELKRICSDIKGDALCFVEKVGAMPGQGVVSMFNFGKSYGYILGVLEADKIPYQLISPHKWKNHFSLSKDKGASVQLAKRLYPQISLLPTVRCKKESDGMAEALLIALYAKRTNGEV